MAATGVDVTWETCADLTCQGVRLGPTGACLAHLDPAALADHLAAAGGPVDLDGRGVRFPRGSFTALLAAVFPPGHPRLVGRVRFDGATFQDQVDLDDTTFRGPVSFAGATFAADARFGNTTFEATAGFDGAAFAGQLWLVGAAFAGPASFCGVAFSGPCWFQRAAFGAGAAFDGATFTAQATFAAVSFAGPASFRRTSFQSRAQLATTTFAAGCAWDDVRFAHKADVPEGALPPPPAAVPLAAAPPVATSAPRRPALARRRPGLRGLAPLAAVVLVGAALYFILRSEPVPTNTVVDPQPLAAGPDLLDSDRAYNFTSTDPIGRPNRFNPCQPVHYAVHPEGAPRGWEDSLNSAIREVSSATGLTFQNDGRSQEDVKAEPLVTLPGASAQAAEITEAYERLFHRKSFQPERYPGRWAPVLVTWVDLPATGAAAGEVGGVGASDPRRTAEGPLVYVSGTVAVSTRTTGGDDLKLVLMHEMGHVVGLSHVSNRAQVMYPEVQPGAVASWGSGDRKGLGRVGKDAGCLNTPAPG